MKAMKFNSRNGKNANEGFSLVEVLVCVAIISIISIPILQGMRTAATLNFKANKTQKATTYAQEEIEKIKALTVQQYTDKMSAEGVARTDIVNGDLFPDVYNNAESIKAAFSGTVDAEKQKELFTPFYFQKDDVTISGRTYTMRTIFEPAVYSQENAAGMASDINVSALVNVTDADASRYPVISDEINSYEAASGSVSAVVRNLQNRLSAKGISMTADEISRQIEKDVNIEIKTDDSGSATISVNCDVTYRCGGEELNYRVYTGTYPYSPTKSEKNADSSISEECGEGSGGNVFIFARAFQPEGITPTTSEHCKNTITITGGGTENMPVNVYLIRGYSLDGTKTYKTDYNFDEITIFGINYFSSESYYKNGEINNGNAGSFYTNIKSNLWDRSGMIDADASELEKMIGKGNYEARCYKITVELLDEDGEAAVRVESTKIEKK